MLQKIKNIKHLLFAVLANILYGFPARKLKVIGVTGTDGKTTTTSLIYWILLQSGKKVAKVTTVSSEINGKISGTSLHTTTPNSFALQKFLATAVKERCEYVVMEVSSHGIDQNRIWGIPFELGALTNITQNEHLDYHGSFENYRATKMGFLKACKNQIINDPKDSSTVKTKMIGEFNQENARLAKRVCQHLHISDNQIDSALQSFTPPPGRLEVVVDDPFKVIVDFAHTPGAFEKVLPVVKELARQSKSKNSGRLIHVFGATGDRDKSKRPLMAKIASQFDDYIILTHEDTYSEDMKQIVSDLEKGLIESKFKNYEIVMDRRMAIEKALTMAKSGDVVILTGVGHQKTMNIGGKEVPWSDQEVVRQLMK